MSGNVGVQRFASVSDSTAEDDFDAKGKKVIVSREEERVKRFRAEKTMARR
jgi:hypothetical protein